MDQKEYLSLHADTINEQDGMNHERGLHTGTNKQLTQRYNWVCSRASTQRPKKTQERVAIGQFLQL
jgi:hypothetical protein